MIELRVAADRRRARRRPGHDRLAPRARGTASAVDLDDPPDPAPGRPDHPEPRKRPRSSYIRFEAAQPNETWQSDFIHWRLADGTDVEILNWLDDHSRYLLSCTAHQPVSGDDVVQTFLAAIDDHGAPAAHADRQRPRLHRPLRRRPQRLRIPPRRSSASARRTAHPDTRKPRARSSASTRPCSAGSRARPPARTLPQLQPQLDEFRDHYNEQRPHRALAPRHPRRGLPAPPRRPPPPAHAPSSTTACATTASTPPAR